MKRPSAINNRAHAVYGYLILISLAFAISGCTAPYYGGRPVPVYFPLYGRSAGYPPQHASSNYWAGSTGVAASRDRSGKAEARRARQRLAEQNKAPARHERHQGESADWIDPVP